MKNLSLTIPTVKNSYLWIVVSVVAIVTLGTWGLLFTDARASQLELIKALNGAGNPALDHLATVVEEFLSPKFAIAITMIIAAILWIGTRSWATAIGFGVAVAFAWLPVGLLKLVFLEQRPQADGLLREAVPSQDFSSFPSGHVSFAIGLVYAFYLLANNTKAKNWVIGLGTLFVVAVAYLRIYVGVHYLTDVIASVFASAAGILAFNLAWTWFTQRVSPKN